MEKTMGVFMDSDMNSHRNYQNSQSNSGLLRFRSAPSSLLENFTNGLEKGLDSCENFSSPISNNPISQSFEDLEGNKSMANGFSVNSQLPPHYPRQTQLTAMDGSYRAVSSMGMDHHRQVKSGSHLMRQSSSPAGLFSHLNSQNDIAGYNTALKREMSYSSGLASSLGILSQISECDSENVEASDHEDIKLGNGNGDTHFYSPRYPFSSWNDSSHFTENFSGLKRDLDGDVKLFAGTQDGELGNRTHMLSHHLSLPKTSSEMAAMEKLLQFQDSVPCKIRAKRGCATHPRSIAERVRRTRISERMRKLQELVPNMDKQTNTADMLDLAVDYIKDLQKQFKTLSENRANCKCSNQRV